MSELIRVPAMEGRNKHIGRTLRCFISVETNFKRLLATHPQAFRDVERSENDSDRHSSNDAEFFIDATAFLTGRVEDQLRYPKLAAARTEEERSSRDKIRSRPWAPYELSLGGHHVDDDEMFGLYWQAEPEDSGVHEPKRIERLSGDGRDGNHPFLQEERGGFMRRIDLLTPRLPDPLQRIRLIKDLLAELFVRFKDCDTRVISIDSLSALIAPIPYDDGPVPVDGARLPILNLIRWLEEYEATTFLACEASRSERETLANEPLFLGAQERYLVSGIIQLAYHRYPSGDLVRYFQLLKVRGAEHDMRPHAYELGGKNGVRWIELLFRGQSVRGEG
jgi:hypothetical protein